MFMVPCVSESSYIQCIVCVAAAYFKILHLEYFRGFPYSYLHLRLYAAMCLGYCQLVFFLSVHKIFTGLNPPFSAFNHIANYI